MKKIIYAILSVMTVISISDHTYAQTPQLTEVLKIIKNKGLYPNYTLVSAHRGYWADYPENTLGAYQMAIDAKADIIEMDVRLTKDGEMVVFHDACLDRMTTGYGRLSDETWEYVNSLKLKMPNGAITQYKMLKLSEALDFLKDKAVIALDIKEGGAKYNTTFVNCLNMLKAKGMLYQSVIKGKLSYVTLSELMTKASVTLNDFLYTPIAFSTTPNLEQYLNEYIKTGKIYAIELVYKQSADPILQYIELLNKNDVWIGTFSFWPECGDGVVAEKVPLTDTDAIVRIYDFKDANPANFLDDGRGDWDWLLSKGADYVITDRSEIMIDYLTIRAKRRK